MPYTPSSSAGSSANTDPFAAFPTNNPIVTNTPPSLNLSSRADDPLLNAKTGTQHDLIEGLFKKSKGEIEALQTKLSAAGVFPGIKINGIADGPTVSAYSTLLNYATLYQTANPANPGGFTPDDVLASLIQNKPKDTTQTSTDKRISLTNPVQARQALLTAFSDKLGRRPTDTEVAAFTQALNSYESSNPSITTTNTDIGTAADGSQTVKSQNSSTSDKGTGSLNFVNDYATNYAQTDPAHAAEYQAAQHLDFYNLALQSLTSGGINTGNTD